MGILKDHNAKLATKALQKVAISATGTALMAGSVVSVAAFNHVQSMNENVHRMAEENHISIPKTAPQSFKDIVESAIAAVKAPPVVEAEIHKAVKPTEHTKVKTTPLFDNAGSLKQKAKNVKPTTPKKKSSLLSTKKIATVGAITNNQSNETINNIGTSDKAKSSTENVERATTKNVTKVVNLKFQIMGKNGAALSHQNAEVTVKGLQTIKGTNISTKWDAIPNIKGYVATEGFENFDIDTSMLPNNQEIFDNTNTLTYTLTAVPKREDTKPDDNSNGSTNNNDNQENGGNTDDKPKPPTITKISKTFTWNLKIINSQGTEIASKITQQQTVEGTRNEDTGQETWDKSTISFSKPTLPDIQGYDTPSNVSTPTIDVATGSEDILTSVTYQVTPPIDNGDDDKPKPPTITKISKTFTWDLAIVNTKGVEIAPKITQQQTVEGTRNEDTGQETWDKSTISFSKPTLPDIQGYDTPSNVSIPTVDVATGSENISTSVTYEETLPIDNGGGQSSGTWTGSQINQNVPKIQEAAKATISTLPASMTASDYTSMNTISVNEINNGAYQSQATMAIQSLKNANYGILFSTSQISQQYNLITQWNARYNNRMLEDINLFRSKIGLKPMAQLTTEKAQSYSGTASIRSFANGMNHLSNAQQQELGVSFGENLSAGTVSSRTSVSPEAMADNDFIAYLNEYQNYTNGGETGHINNFMMYSSSLSSVFVPKAKTVSAGIFGSLSQFDWSSATSFGN